jgi:hypothetical protein
LSNLYFLIAVGLFLAVLAAISIRHYLNAQRSSRDTWESLLNRLTWVDRDNISMIALDLITESGEPRRTETATALDPSAIWTLVGGLDGLEALEHNCQVLVELAAYMQKWYPEALVIAEQLRLNAREIKWHVGRLKGAAKTGNLQASFADYAQRAVATYYLMTQHVLALYEQARFPGLTKLKQAI